MVAAIGADVRGFSVGDRVVAFTGLGAFADYVSVTATQAFRLPAGVDLTDAAGLLIA